MGDERAVNGDFHVIKMDGLFHVVFRPDEDPEWFRIIATFYTYERAWSYCDIERVSVWNYVDSKTGEASAESHTGDEEMAGLRAPPSDPIPEGWMASRDGCAEMVRSVFPEADAIIPPHPDEDFSDRPNEDELPKDYHERIFKEAVARQARDLPKEVVAELSKKGQRAVADALAEQPQPEPDVELDAYAQAVSELSANQWSVLKFFQGRAEIGETASGTLKEIASEAGVSLGSMGYFIETLERKGFLSVVERGNSTTPGVFRLTDPTASVDTPGPKCKSCGQPRTPGSASQCLACYRAKVPA